MNLKPILLVWGCMIGFLPLTFIPSPSSAQTLVKPIPNRSPDEDFHYLQRGIYQWVISEFRQSGRSLRGTKVEISSLIYSGEWATGVWMITGRNYPEGIAGQVLMKQQGQRWVFVAGAGGAFDANTLIRLGVPPENAQGLADGPDI